MIGFFIGEYTTLGDCRQVTPLKGQQKILAEFVLPIIRIFGLLNWILKHVYKYSLSSQPINGQTASNGLFVAHFFQGRFPQFLSDHFRDKIPARPAPSQ